MIGFLSARPAFRCYYDATEMKENTLTKNSLELWKAGWSLTITTYVNMLDEDYFRANARYYNEDFERFRKIHSFQNRNR